MNTLKQLKETSPKFTVSKQLRKGIVYEPKSPKSPYDAYKKDANEQTINAEVYNTKNAHDLAGHAHIRAAKHSPTLSIAKIHLKMAIDHLNI